MAQPALIYAFDNLGPERFAQLCGLLLGNRYRGFAAGGPGPDGGIDARANPWLGVWQTDAPDVLGELVVPPDSEIVFQFKHLVTARAGGQVAARRKLLQLYKCSKRKPCELHKRAIARDNPKGYVLVTNVEATEDFRQAFQRQCQQERPEIPQYHVLGLDDLAWWLASSPELRAMWFPTIFGPPRFNLRVEANCGQQLAFFAGGHPTKKTDVLQVTVANVGTCTSYVSETLLLVLADGISQWLHLLDLSPVGAVPANPEPGTPLEPGRCQRHLFPLDTFCQLRGIGREVFPVEFAVRDEIGNVYRAVLSDDVRQRIMGLRENT